MSGGLVEEMNEMNMSCLPGGIVPVHLQVQVVTRRALHLQTNVLPYRQKVTYTSSLNACLSAFAQGIGATPGIRLHNS
jgi:hypothetical protein